MPDTEDDKEFDKAFEGFGDNPAVVTPPADPTPPAAPVVPPTPAPEVPPVQLPKPAEEPKKDEKPPEETPKVEPPAPADDKKPEEGAKSPETPTPPVEPPEAPAALTKDDLKDVVSDLLTSERNSSKELDTTTKEVLDAYYPEGLSNVLIDEKSGKELRSPQDVIEASGGTMSSDEATQWLMNEQFKLDTQVAKIKDDAKHIAETTVSFKRDSMNALQKYDPLFKAYPTLQKKAFDLMMKQVKVDDKKGVILSAPDVMDLYDTYLEPYQQAYEFSTKQSATNPTPPPTPPAATPSAEDRLDESGDGGQSAPDDPNDFAQQVTKELAKGM